MCAISLAVPPELGISRNTVIRMWKKSVYAVRKRSEDSKVMPDYSVCMLCYNDAERLRESLDSVLELSKFVSMEVIVVDNLSTDGSREILADYRKRGLITCIERNCTRGKGRQIALEASQGKYILAHLDCDDVFSPSGIGDLLALYHRDYEGLMLVTKRTTVDERSNITIGPSELFRSLGWRTGSKIGTSGTGPGRWASTSFWCIRSPVRRTSQ